MKAETVKFKCGHRARVMLVPPNYMIALLGLDGALRIARDSCLSEPCPACRDERSN